MLVCMINYFISPVKMKFLIAFVTCLILWSMTLLSFSNIFKNQLLGVIINGSKDSEKLRDKLLGGLLTAEFDEDSCLSRYQASSLYRKPSSLYNASQYLISTLRNYERLHKRCGPGTFSYKRATKKLSHDDHDQNHGECKYIVWVSLSGLGNQILSITSVFLYALLTERIILVDQRKDITDLFCEPFPRTSWFLPLDFPLMDKVDSLDMVYSRSYGKMLRTHAINSTASPPSHLYLHLIPNYKDPDKMFYCEKDQDFFKKVPWLIVKSNMYFVPSLWLNTIFQTELIKLFPQKETVFYHLVHYLFHPTNQVWGMVTRSYKAYLSRADEILGIQVRIFARRPGYFQHVMDQIIACIQKEKLLPEASATQETNTTKSAKLKAVLVTSLYPEYSNTLKNMYWERPTSTGEIIEIYQPSGERVQQTDKKLHDQKALAEMYLLSLTDKLVTSAWSTFGYVAQGLGGLRPWILYIPKRGRTPDPPCGRGISMEPCFLTPPARGCEANRRFDSGNIIPFVRRCDDLQYKDGLKLV